jgi:hypothetical protein
MGLLAAWRHGFPELCRRKEHEFILTPFRTVNICVTNVVGIRIDFKSIDNPQEWTSGSQNCGVVLSTLEE